MARSYGTANNSKLSRFSMTYMPDSRSSVEIGGGGRTTKGCMRVNVKACDGLDTRVQFQTPGISPIIFELRPAAPFNLFIKGVLVVLGIAYIVGVGVSIGTLVNLFLAGIFQL